MNMRNPRFFGRDQRISELSDESKRIINDLLYILTL